LHRKNEKKKVWLSFFASPRHPTITPLEPDIQVRRF
jgi:hypothetical protein